MAAAVSYCRGACRPITNSTPVARMRHAQPIVKHAPCPSNPSHSSQTGRRWCSIISSRADHLRSSRMTAVATWCLLLWGVSSMSPSCRASSSTSLSVNGSGHQRRAMINSAPFMKHLTAQRRSDGTTETKNHRSRSCGNSSAQDTCARRYSAVDERNNLPAGGGGGPSSHRARVIRGLKFFKRADTSASATTTTLLHRTTRQEQHKHGHCCHRRLLLMWVQLRSRDAPDTKGAGKGLKPSRQQEHTPCAPPEEAGQQPTPKRQRMDYLSAQTAAMVETLGSGPSALRSSASMAAASVVAACTTPTQFADMSEDSTAVLPPKSYLLWPTTLREAQGRDVKLVADARSPLEEPGDRNSDEKESTSKRRGSLRTAKESRGGAAAAAAQVSLSFKQAMFAGAVSRSIAQTCMQPANVVKTLLQGRGTSKQLSKMSFSLLTRGAGAQFIMSLPHGAFNYATLEVILECTAKIFPDEWRERAGPGLDFLSSSVATLVCSVVSTPQMVITDRIMAGMYPNLVSGVREIAKTSGLGGFYTGWSANVAQKIPSYGLTWVFFQQFKRLHRKVADHAPTNTENFALGAAAAGATVCIMIPMDTVKTRLVTQTAQAGLVPYRGVLRTLVRVVKEEGAGSMYRALTPRLVSVVPMIGIQFGIYEFIRNEFISRRERELPKPWLPEGVRRTLGLYRPGGTQQHEYVKDFLHNVVLMEEDLV